MTEQQTIVSPDETEDWSTIVKLIKNWKIIFLFAFIGMFSAAGISLLIKNEFTAEVEFIIGSPMGGENTSALDSIKNQFMMTSGGTRSEEYMRIIQSKKLIKKFIKKYELLPILGTINPQSTDDDQSFILNRQTEFFSSEVLTISKPLSATHLNLTIVWNDPKIVTEWANNYIKFANETLRLDESIRNTKILTQLKVIYQSEKIVDIKNAVIGLMTQKISDLALANADTDHPFRVIDPAIMPGIKSGPKRTLMTLLGLLTGFFIGILVVSIRKK
jgi:uncharacterized protein involved in exopolysaccharide biosynthesis